MSSNLIKIIAGVFIALAAVLGVVAWHLGNNLANTSNNAAQAQQNQAAAAAANPKTDLVVAIKPLPANQPIDPASLKVIGVEVVPSSGYFTKVEDVTGLTPLVDIDAGMPVTPQFLKGNPVAKQIPAGSKAVSLTLTDVIGVGGFVRPGDIVDVLVYLRNDQQNKVDPAQARILQKDALVLAFDDHFVNPLPADKSQNGQAPQPQPQHHERTVVVAVPDSEVTRVMLGASMGDVRLALHGQSQDQPPQAPAPAADAATAPATATAAAGAPTPVSGASLPPQQASVASAKSDAQSDLPDEPYTSSDLAKLKPKHAAKGAPQGIVIYRGTAKASTVYP